MSTGQELEELKAQISLILQCQTTIIQDLQKLQCKINKIEATLEMVSELATPKTIELIRDKVWK